MSELDRFREAQERNHATALTEIEGGKKQSHWMWFIFPQLSGLGNSDTARYYAIKDIDEASAYLFDQDLGYRLTEISKALLALETSDARAVFGSPDDVKLRSSMTLFEAVPATFPVFGQVLDKFFGGERDQRTLDILQRK